MFSVVNSVVTCRPIFTFCCFLICGILWVIVYLISFGVCGLLYWCSMFSCCFCLFIAQFNVLCLYCLVFFWLLVCGLLLLGLIVGMLWMLDWFCLRLCLLNNVAAFSSFVFSFIWFTLFSCCVEFLLVLWLGLVCLIAWFLVGFVCFVGWLLVCLFD